MHASDRLLAEVLRVQGLVDENVLARAMDVWKREAPDQPLGQFLLKRRVLGAETYLRVNELLQGYAVGCPNCSAVYSLTDYFPRLDRSGHGAKSAVCPSCQVNLAAPDLLESIVDGSEDELAFGRYEILDEVGRGGMGVVYQALDHETGETVALKVLLSQNFSNDTHVARFQREINAARRLDHPDIIPVLDAGEAEGVHYLTMPFVEGRPFDKATRDLPLAESLPIFLRVVEAMEHAHAEGILHRDLKPDNVLVDDAGNPYVTDFGLAKQTETTDSGLTRTGMMLGTPFYMAPETILHGAKETDERGDIWSLGIMLYEILADELPFEAESATELYRNICHEKPAFRHKDGLDRPRGLWHVCRRALTTDREKRYPTMSAFADDLARVMEGGAPIPLRPIGIGVGILCLGLLGFWAMGGFANETAETGTATGTEKEASGTTSDAGDSDAPGTAGAIEAALEAGRIAEAEKALLSLSPDDPEFERLGGVLKNMKGDPEGALPLLGRALRDNPNDLLLRRHHLLASVAISDWSSARRDARMLKSLAPESAAAWRAVARLELATGTIEDTRAAIEEALKLDSSHPTGHTLLGWFEYESGERSLAKAHFERALELRPDQTEAKLGLATVLAHKDKLEQARSLIDEVRSNSPESAAIHRAEAAVHHFEKERAEALKALERAVELDPDDPENWFALGRQRIVQKKVREGLTAIDRAFELNPHLSKAAYWRAVALFVMKDYKKVIETAEEHRDGIRDPDNRLKLDALVAKAHFRRKEFAKSLPPFRRVNKKSRKPKKENLHLHFQAAYIMGEYKEAEKLLEKWKKELGETALLRSDLVILYASKRNPFRDAKLALEIAKRGMEQPRLNVLDLESWAYALWRNDRLEEAIKAQRRAIAATPSTASRGLKNRLDNRLERMLEEQEQ